MIEKLNVKIIYVDLLSLKCKVPSFYRSGLKLVINTLHLDGWRLSILSERNFMVEMTSLQGKELERLLWVHIAFIVLAVAHLQLLSGLNV